MCNCSSFRENCVTHARTQARMHARTHAHGANYNLPPASRAGDKKSTNETISRHLASYLHIGMSRDLTTAFNIC